MITRRDFLKLTAAGGALASMGNIAEAKEKIKSVIPDNNLCLESARSIPILSDTDIVVVGGNTRAIAAAAAAAKTGCKVFVITPMPYFGDDICGAMFYDREKGEEPKTALARKIFRDASYPIPMTVKSVLENELIDLDIPFLYSTFPTDTLVDENGNVAGIVIANRSGRQAIKAKTVIDATQDASVARMANMKFQPFQIADQEFIYTVAGNKPKTAPGIIKSEVLTKPLKVADKEYPITRYTFKMPLKDNSYDTIMEFEQKARNATWDLEQVDSSDGIWYIPNQTIKSKGIYNGTAEIRKLPVSAFQPEEASTLWVLGPMAEVPRDVAAKIMRPINALFLGELLGEYIGNNVRTLQAPNKVVVMSSSDNGVNLGEIHEILKPLRPSIKKGFIECGSGTLPILGSYDVVVLGGGTAGASAGIGAARQGVNTLMLEYLHGLGGLSTIGMIGVYWDGFRGGFTASLNKGVYDMAPTDHPRRLKNPDAECPADWKMEWLREEYLKAGGKLWFGCLGCGALEENGKIKGIVVATPQGRGVILSKVLIDSTGSADIAIAAGADYETTGKSIAVQGCGTGTWKPGDHYNNNDWLFVDDSDALDITRAFIQAKQKFSNAYDIVKMPQTRERRRMKGEYTISVCDVINKRRYADTISFHKSSFDTHGMIVDPYFMLAPPEERHTIYDADVPLRALLPKGIEGIMVTGLGASADRDAMPVIRMQPCLQNQGFAVGYLAATSVKDNLPLRKVDIKKVQRYLVKMGNLPERVLTDKNFKGYSNKEMKAAVSTIGDKYKGLEILLTDKNQSLPIVAKELANTHDLTARINLASILCMLGNSDGTSIIAEAVKNNQEWDKGWHYTGMGQFGMSLSRLDALITALGKTKQKMILPVILDKAQLLQPEDYFSHFRAISMATESIASSDAIPILAGLLSIPGVRYHSMDTYREARNQSVPGGNDVSTRNLALKELHLARALYACGDYNGIGEEVLRRYANGLQAHYARYAAEILEKKS